MVLPAISRLHHVPQAASCPTPWNLSSQVRGGRDREGLGSSCLGLQPRERVREPGEDAGELWLLAAYAGKERGCRDILQPIQAGSGLEAK